MIIILKEWLILNFNSEYNNSKPNQHHTPHAISPALEALSHLKRHQSDLLNQHCPHPRDLRYRFKEKKVSACNPVGLAPRSRLDRADNHASPVSSELCCVHSQSVSWPMTHIGLTVFCSLKPTWSHKCSKNKRKIALRLHKHNRVWIFMTGRLNLPLKLVLETYFRACD